MHRNLPNAHIQQKQICCAPGPWSLSGVLFFQYRKDVITMIIIRRRRRRRRRGEKEEEKEKEKEK